MVVGSWSDVVTGVVIVLEFVVPVSYFVEVLSDVAVEALAGGMGVEVLADVNVNASAADSKCAMPAPLDEPMPCC